MSSEPNGSFNFTADFLASETCAVGDLLVKDEALGVWRVATTANRASAAARTTAVARTAYGGSIVGKVMYQMSGRVPASMTGLGVGVASWVRASAAGRFERVTPAGADDVVGYASADGSVTFFPGVMTATIIAGGGGGGATPGGSVGSSQYQIDATTFGGRAHGAVGSVLRQDGAASASFGPLDLDDSDARTGTLPIANIDAGTNGDVLTTAAGVPAWATIVNANVNAAAAIAVSKLAAGTNTHVLTTVAGVPTWSAAGAGFTAPTGTGAMWVTAGAMDAAAKTSIDVNTDVILTQSGAAQYGLLVHNGTRYVNQVKGSNNTVWTISSIGVGQYAAVSLTAMVTGTLPLGNGGTGLTAVPGSNGSFIINSSSAYGAAAGISHPASGAIAFGTNSASVGSLRFPTASLVKFRNNANSADLTALHTDSSDRLWVGSTNGSAEQFAQTYVCGSAGVSAVINGSIVFAVGGTSVTTTQPLLGSSSPYALNGEITMANTTASLSAAQYSRVAYNFSSGSSGTLTFPTPAGADNSYVKFCRSQTGVSTTTLTVGGTTANLTANTTGVFVFAPSGVFRVAT